MRSILVIILFTIALNSQGQTILDSLTKSQARKYTSLSYKSRRVPSAISTNVALLANHLTQDLKSDLEKVRAFYIWIISNIKYDMKSYKAEIFTNQKPDVVIARRTALCQGYADLFHELCKEVGIKSVVLTGYSKGYGYVPGQKFEMSDHAWNSVKINGVWYLLDATWGSSGANSTSFEEADKYFLTQPSEFVYDHLPLDPVWQFLDPPVPLDIFEQGETEIITYILSNGGSLNLGQKPFNYKDSLRNWELKGDAQAKIDSHKRSISFNPKNKRSVYRLGVELLFKALELMDNIHNVSYSGFENRVIEMQKEMFDLLDEAAFHFANVPESHPDFESASALVEEVTYQKGVFYYEVGQRVYDIFLEMNKDDFLKNLEKGKSQIDDYYGLAIYYFDLVDKESRYFDQAREYVEKYMRNPLVPRN